MANDYRIALVEDTAEDAENCISLLQQYAAEKDMHFDIAHFSNGETFLTEFKSQFDLIILDIELGDRNGIDVARVIRESDNEVMIMFTTNLAKYATNGYEVSAIDYILKPLRYPSFSLKFDRISKKLKSKQTDPIVVRTEAGFVKIDLADTLYLEVFAHDILFHLSESTVKTYGTLKKFEEQLRQHHFYRCNSCYLVNAAKIESIAQYDILLSNGETIKISHPRRKEFISDFKRYIIEEAN